MQYIGEIYHIYNRTVAKEAAFTRLSDKKRCLDLLKYYRFKHSIRFSAFRLLSLEKKDRYLAIITQNSPLVEIFAYVIMPDHYHLLLRPIAEDGARIFLTNFQNSYAKYYNLKYSRHGSLFQNRYKARRIIDTEDFKGVSRYIHLNPLSADIISKKKMLIAPWSSLYYYKKSKGSFINTDAILDEFGSLKKYLVYLFTHRR
jgi:putative transposase